MLSLTKEELKSNQNAKVCYICGTGFLKKFTNNKNCRKVRDPCHFTGNVANEIHVVFHNGSN